MDTNSSPLFNNESMTNLRWRTCRAWACKTCSSLPTKLFLSTKFVLETLFKGFKIFELIACAFISKKYLRQAHHLERGLVSHSC